MFIKINEKYDTGENGCYWTTRKYRRSIVENFEAPYLLENMLATIRRFGFVHFCSGSIFNTENIHEFNREYMDDLENFRSFRGWTTVTVDYWWRGYSPYDQSYSETFESMLDALMVFEGDPRLRSQG